VIRKYGPVTSWLRWRSIQRWLRWRSIQRWLSACWQCGQWRWPQECGTTRSAAQASLLHWAVKVAAEPGAAVLQRAQGLALAGQRLELRKVLRAEAIDDAGQRDHRTAPQCRSKRPISASMRARAWVSVPALSWV